MDRKKARLTTWAKKSSNAPRHYYRLGKPNNVGDRFLQGNNVMRCSAFLIAAVLFGIPLSAALAGSINRDDSNSLPMQEKRLSDVDVGSALNRVADSRVKSAPNLRRGHWVCIADSTLGSHGTTTVWSKYAASMQQAKRSALRKCNADAANKQDCSISRCWLDGHSGSLDIEY